MRIFIVDSSSWTSLSFYAFPFSSSQYTTVSSIWSPIVPSQNEVPKLSSLFPAAIVSPLSMKHLHQDSTRFFNESIYQCVLRSSLPPFMDCQALRLFTSLHLSSSSDILQNNSYSSLYWLRGQPFRFLTQVSFIPHPADFHNCAFAPHTFSVPGAWVDCSQ